MWTALRVVVSLAAVLGLVWVLAGVARRRTAGQVAGAGRFAVVGRQALGRGAGVAVVRVGEQALVLGVTEHSVRLLAQTALSDVVPPADTTVGEVRELVLAGAEEDAAPSGPRDGAHGGAAAAPPSRPGRHLATVPTPAASPLAGSALSPATWRGAVDVLRERTTRR